MRTTMPSFNVGLLQGSAVLFALALGMGELIAQDASPAKVESSPTSVATSQSEAAGAATQKSDTEMDGVTAELTSVTRTDGDTLTIKFKYTNGSQKDVKLAELSENSYDNLAEKIYYIDGKNKKKYTVIKDSGGVPVASNMKAVQLAPGESKGAWSKLPAPPAGVNTISVYLPGTPPFESVKITP